MMRSANPALNDRAFTKAGHAVDGHAMTIQGTVNKTAALLIVLVLCAGMTWTAASAAPWILIGALGGFVVAIVTVVKPQWSPVTVPIYAILEGLFLGALSAIFERRFPGIVIQAVALTFGTLFALLMAYKSGMIKVTENFKLGVAAATGGIFLVYLVSMVLNMFGTGIPYIHGSGLIGIGFSLFVIVIAALNLVLDFDFIEKGAERGAPKYMEWYAAFGLLVTLIWLYIEFLRLLAKLQSRR